MPLGLDNARRTIAQLRSALDDAGAAARLAPRATTAPKVRVSVRATAARVKRIWQLLQSAGVSAEARDTIADPTTLATLAAYQANVEAMIGTTKVPLGVAGPLLVNGLHAEGAFYVPLATTEAALVASYARGAEVVTAAGGVAAAVTSRAVIRAPAFEFETMLEAGRFVAWVCDNEERLAAAAEATTRHGRLVDIEPHMLGESLYLICRYETGDAAGQNMATIATDALCREIEAACPIRPKYWFLEANFSGDKKASHLALLSARGRRVSASVTIPGTIVRRKLHTEVETMLAYGRLANLGALASGTLGAHGHIANGLAALYLATGQDVACVAESAVGFLRMDGSRTGGEAALHATLTLPNIIVGTVGGGTGLPSQAAALDLLGLWGAGKADALAEVTAALCLAGEVSIIGALAAGEFASAHARLARERRK